MLTIQKQNVAKLIGFTKSPVIYVAEYYSAQYIKGGFFYEKTIENFYSYIGIGNSH